MRSLIKSLLNRLCQLLVLPLAIPCILEDKLVKGHVEVIFNMCSHIVAILPGLPGSFLRRAFYSLTLEKCSLNSHIGFGTIFSHRSVIIEDYVYIGNYALIGSVIIGEYSLIGSRVSILNSNSLHELDENGRWTPFSADMLEKVDIAKNVWIGEGAIVMANVGESSMVGAGSVVTTNVKSFILVAGIPGRFVKNLEIPQHKERSTQEKINND